MVELIAAEFCPSLWDFDAHLHSGRCSVCSVLAQGSEGHAVGKSDIHTCNCVSCMSVHVDVYTCLHMWVCVQFGCYLLLWDLSPPCVMPVSKT